MTTGRLIVLCGLPGSGKTTTARRICEERAAVRMSPDEWMEILAIDLYDQPARSRIETLQWQVAEQLLRLGTTVVLEWGTWSRRERDELRTRCRAMGVAVELRYLDVPIEELWRRVDARNRQGGVVISREDLVAWVDLFDAPDAAELSRFDPPLPAG